MRGPVETHLINVQLNVQRDPYSRAVLASDVFKLLTLLTPMFTCRSLALLLPESSCSSWRAVRTPGHPQVKQVTQDVSGRAGGGLVSWCETLGRGPEARAWINKLSPEQCPRLACPPAPEVSTVVSLGGPS